MIYFLTILNKASGSTKMLFAPQLEQLLKLIDMEWEFRDILEDYICMGGPEPDSADEVVDTDAVLGIVGAFPALCVTANEQGINVAGLTLNIGEPPSEDNDTHCLPRVQYVPYGSWKTHELN